jgi:hypothetical protein
MRGGGERKDCEKVNNTGGGWREGRGREEVEGQEDLGESAYQSPIQPFPILNDVAVQIKAAHNTESLAVSGVKLLPFPFPLPPIVGSISRILPGRKTP